MKILPSGNGINGHSTGSPILAVACSENGNHLVSTAVDRTICLWALSSDLSLATRKATRQGEHLSTCVGFHPGHGQIAVGQSDGSIQFWTAGETLEPAARIEEAHTGGVSHLTFSPDGEHFVSAGVDKTLVMWKSEAHTRLWTVALSDGTDSVAFSWNGSAVTACSGGRLLLYRAESGEQNGTRTVDGPIRTVACQRLYGRLLAYGSDAGSITIETLTQVQTLMAPPPIRWLGFPARFLAVACHAVGMGPTQLVQRWPAEHAPLSTTIDEQPGSFSTSTNAYASSPFGHRIAAGTQAGHVWVW